MRRSDDMAGNLDALLHLTQVLESAQAARKLRLDLVTRNAQAAGRDPQPTSVAQAPAIGLIRVISTSIPISVGARSIFPLEHPWQMRHRFGTSFRARTRNARSPCAAKRVTSGDSIAAARPRAMARSGLPLRLESRERGHLDTLHFAHLSCRNVDRVRY